MFARPGAGALVTLALIAAVPLPRTHRRGRMTGMATPTEFVLPQLGIFAQGTAAHHFLEFDLHPGVTPAEAIDSFRRLRAPDVSAGGVNVVLGVSAGTWRDVAPAEHVPADLADFRAIVGVDGRGAPATQHDAWVWISGAAPDIAWDHARAAAAAVADVASLAAEQPGFTYRDGRDMTGFVDGTANPPTRQAPHVAMVPLGQAGAGRLSRPGDPLGARPRPLLGAPRRRAGIGVRADEARQYRARAAGPAADRAHLARPGGRRARR